MFLTPSDLEPFAEISAAKAAAMIEDSEAMAVLAAPCITTPEFQSDAAKMGAIKSILRGAILRWDDVGSGGVTQQGAGPFQQTIDTSKVRRGMFWPSEIEQLRGLCAGGATGAFSIDTAPDRGSMHPSFCSLYFDGPCSCGIVDVGRVYEPYGGWS